MWWVMARLIAFEEADRSQRQQQCYSTYQEEEGDNEEYIGAYGGSMSKKER
jgi:hypothetical protein